MLDYATLEKWLGKADITFSASFTHGLLSAYCCQHDGNSHWAKLLITDRDAMDVSQQRAITKLEGAKQDINEQLADASLSFQLLLDDQAENIREEVLSTREWASGFWLGIKELGFMQHCKENNAIEFMQDLQRIAAMPLPEEEDGDSHSDLIEIQEYCRMGAISLYLTSWNP